MDHLGTDEQFELFTFTLVHTRQSGAFLGSFFPGGIYKKLETTRFFSLGLL